MSTVIDQFVVKYTVDTSGLDKGTQDAEKKVESLNSKLKDAGDALGDGLSAGAKRATGSLGVLGSMLGKGGLIGVAIGSIVYAGKIIDDKLFSVAQGLRKLGIDSKNFGIAAAGLRNLQNASELAGGSIDDATRDVSDLSKSLFNLKFNGQVSDSLVMLSRLGVQFQDSYGRARDFNDVMLDTADAIEKAKASGRMTDAEGYQFAIQSGFTGGDANLVNGGRANLEKQLAKQGARTQATAGAIKAGTDWVVAKESKGQAYVAEAGIKGVNQFGEARAGADELLEQAATKAAASLEHFTQVLDRTFVHSAGGTARGSIPSTRTGAATTPHAGRGGGAFSSGGSIGGKGGKFSNAISAASAKYGIPEDVLTGLLRTESGFNPNAVNTRTGARGIAQMMPDTAKSLGVVAGANADDDIMAAAKYLSQLRKSGVANGLDSSSALKYAIDAYHTGAGNIAKGANIGPESMAYSGKVLAGTAYQNLSSPWMKGGGDTTHVQIDNVNIQTQATDAEGITTDFTSDLVKRKLIAAQAEAGLN